MIYITSNSSGVTVSEHYQRLLRWFGLLLAIGLIVQMISVIEAQEGDVPCVNNPADPPVREVWAYDELWRVGGDDDDDLLFGVVNSVIGDEEGNIYILDRQMCQVSVVTASGEFVRMLGREGEGPGEIRLPNQLLLLDKQTIGITQGFPSKLVKVTTSDDPTGSVMIGSCDPGERGSRITIQMEYRDHNLMVFGSKLSYSSAGQSATMYLARFDEKGCEQYRFAEMAEKNNIEGNVWRINEKDNYFPARRWALGSEGTVYLAPERDLYKIHVLSAAGDLKRVIIREARPHKRTKDELDAVKGQYSSNMAQLEYKFSLEEYDPLISAISYEKNGSLWVTGCDATRDLPEGVCWRYDVFDEGGHFTREILIEMPFDATEDRFFHVGENRIIRVTGVASAEISSSRASGFSSGNDHEKEKDPELIPPLQVIMYEKKSIREVK